MPTRQRFNRLFTQTLPPVFIYEVTVTDGQATTPKYTFIAGAPAAMIEWGDGSAQEAVTSAVELTHTYASAGTYLVTLLQPRQDKWLGAIDINTDKVSKIVSPIQLFKRLASIRLYANSLWAQDISSWQLPSVLVTFQIYTTGITGDVSHWLIPSTCTSFLIYSTSLTGSVSAWVVPAAMLNFWIHTTALTGCPILSSMVAIQAIRAYTCSLPEATVDLYLSRCVAVEAQTTYATPALSIGTGNAAPSVAGAADKLTLQGLGWVVTTT